MEVLQKKTILRFGILGILSMSISLTSCTTNELPKPTERGKNTLGMKVNGEIWRPYMPTSAFYSFKPEVYFDTISNLLLLTGWRIEKMGGGYFILYGSVKNAGISHVNYGRFPDSARYNVYDSTSYLIGDQTKPYKLRDSTSSLLIITRFDSKEKIIAGQFAFDLINSDEDTVHITDGVFDVTYE